jgi:hypothetical protein
MSDLGHGCKNVFPPKTARNRAVAAILVGLTGQSASDDGALRLANVVCRRVVCELRQGYRTPMTLPCLTCLQIVTSRIDTDAFWRLPH